MVVVASRRAVTAVSRTVSVAEVVRQAGILANRIYYCIGSFRSYIYIKKKLQIIRFLLFFLFEWCFWIRYSGCIILTLIKQATIPKATVIPKVFIFSASDRRMRGTPIPYETRLPYPIFCQRCSVFIPTPIAFCFLYFHVPLIRLRLKESIARLFRILQWHVV